MDHDLAPRDDRPATPDDAQLGVLVRAVADDWHRPPQRLDQATWRERVEGGRHAVRGAGPAVAAGSGGSLRRGCWPSSPPSSSR